MVAGMAGPVSKSMALSAMMGVVRAVFLAGFHAGEVNLNWNLILDFLAAIASLQVPPTRQDRQQCKKLVPSGDVQ